MVEAEVRLKIRLYFLGNKLRMKKDIDPIVHTHWRLGLAQKEGKFEKRLFLVKKRPNNIYKGQ